MSLEEIRRLLSGAPQQRHAITMSAGDQRGAYLLAPVDRMRIDRALHRVRSRALPPERQLASALASVRRDEPKPRLVVREPGLITFVDFDDIDWIEASGNNVLVHARGATHQTRATMTAIELRLDARFLRVHRSAIVNTDRIRRIRIEPSERIWVVLRDGTEVPAGRYLEPRVTSWVRGALLTPAGAATRAKDTTSPAVRALRSAARGGQR